MSVVRRNSGLTDDRVPRGTARPPTVDDQGISVVERNVDKVTVDFIFG
jgi:hypothetical protein